jgi:hypothetical protein
MLLVPGKIRCVGLLDFTSWQPQPMVSPVREMTAAVNEPQKATDVAL